MVFVDSLSRSGRCVVCAWLTVTAVPIWDEYVYCCDDRTCKEQFKSAILKSLSRHAVYSKENND